MFSLLFFGVLGWAMKHFQWPRPPLVLGFILGEVIERYMFISIERYGIQLDAASGRRGDVRYGGADPAAAVAAGRAQPWRPQAMVSQWGQPQFAVNNLFAAALLCLFVAMLGESFEWTFAARIIPTIVGTGAILFCASA